MAKDDDQDEGTKDAPPAGDPKPEDNKGDKKKPEPYAVFPDADSFKARVKREAAGILKKELGDIDLAAIKTIISEHKELKTAAEKKRTEELSEAEKLREQLDAKAKEAEAAAAELATERRRAEVLELGLQHGVKDGGYLEFRLAEARRKAAEGEEVDEEALLKGWLEDATERTRFGLEAPPEEVEEGATTTPAGGPAPKPDGKKPPTKKDVMDMSREEFTEYQRSLGINI